jgi:hypothetical protein
MGGPGFDFKRKRKLHCTQAAPACTHAAASETADEAASLFSLCAADDVDAGVSIAVMTLSSAP